MNQLMVILSMAFLSYWVSACTDRERQLQLEQALLEKRLQERLDMARQQRIEDCNRRLQDSALFRVDAIRLLEIKAALDTVNRPYKPAKPVHPGPGRLADSLIIKPLLPDTITKIK